MLVLLSFARTIDAAKKYVVSSTLDRVVWKAGLVGGDLGKAVQQLKRESGKGLIAEGVKEHKAAMRKKAAAGTNSAAASPGGQISATMTPKRANKVSARQWRSTLRTCAI